MNNMGGSLYQQKEPSAFVDFLQKYAFIATWSGWICHETEKASSMRFWTTKVAQFMYEISNDSKTAMETTNLKSL